MWTLLLIAIAAAAPLQLETVLDAVDSRVPQVAVAEAKLESADAKRLYWSGAFDPEVSAQGVAYGGKDERRFLDAGVGGSTLLGPAWRTGYRVGAGSFPTYDGKGTADGGEAYARLEIPILEGLIQGGERAERDGAIWDARSTASMLESKRLEVRQKAALAYWAWVAAGAERDIASDLLALADSRAAALQRQVETGAAPRIDQLDNERVLFERRDLLAKADASVAKAAQTLSLYFRDADGRPLAPTLDQLPSDLSDDVELRTEAEDLAAAMDRPDVAAIDRRVDSSRARLAGARNGLMPTLDLSVEHSVALDGSERESIGGVSLHSSMLRRSERGKAAELEASLAGVVAELRGQRDLARAQVLATRATVEAARRRVIAAAQAVDFAAEVVELERRRFELGGSTLFTLLQREEKLASARKSLVEAQLAARVAEANLEAASGLPLR